MIVFPADIKCVDLPVEPMLLIFFVENAFKRGIGMMDDPVIYINLTCVDNTLIFKVKNKFRSSVETKESSSGIGIHNGRRSLELLYKYLYELKIFESVSWFIVELKMILK